MKTIKLLIATLMIGSACFGQAISPTIQNPSNWAGTQWDANQSRYMMQPFYNDIISINNIATTTSGSNTFAGTNIFNGAVFQKENVVQDSAGPAVTLTAAQTGITVYMKKVSGDTIILPASAGCSVGTHFKIYLVYSVTSVGHTVQTSGSDVFYGTAFVSSTTSAYTSPFLSTANKRIIGSSTTTGGLAGGELDFCYMGFGRWYTHALLYATGAPATPFSN